MVIDTLENAPLYQSLGERIQLAFGYIRETDFAEVDDGKYEISGDEVYAMVQSYAPKGEDGREFEAHRKYIDVQYICKGVEKIGYAPLADQVVTMDYDAEKDCAFYTGDISFVTMEAGMFAIFYPNDLHMPGVEITPSDVQKVVVKVLIQG